MRGQPNFKIVTENIVVALEKRKFRKKTPATARYEAVLGEAEGGTDYQGEEELVRVETALCLGDGPSNRRGQPHPDTDYIPASMQTGQEDEGGRDYRGH